MFGSEPDVIRSIAEEYFSNSLLQKVLELVLLTATGPEVYVATIPTYLSDSYDD